MTIRTRFAPSPTGYLHIGGVRTALFNWLLARQQGGRFILRIDDTDTKRNMAEALGPILDGFKWLGLDWDEGPDKDGPFASYFQSQRGDLYRDAAMKLLDAGHAYPAYETPDELKAQREAAQAKKENFIYRGPHRDNPPAENRRLYDQGPTILRLKVPAGRQVVIDDLIRGRVEWSTDEIGDPVIFRADGTPLYNFATVVDDVQMQITHVIRAQEHLTNTNIQALVYEALGYPVPRFAHVPVINEPGSDKKLSKRNMKKFVTPEVREKLHMIGYSDEEIDSRDDLNPATVAYYRELGYLPDAVVNALVRLGWSRDETTEKLPRGEMISDFSLDRVNKSPASFDPDKMLWFAAEYMKELPLDDKVAGVLPFLTRVGLIPEPVDAATRDQVRRIVEATGDRLRIFSDILIHAPQFLREPEYDPKAVDKKLKKDGAAELLADFRAELAAAEPYEAGPLEQKLSTFCDGRGVKKSLLVHALRVALTGKEVGLGLYETLVILGREESLRRIDMGLSLARA